MYFIVTFSYINDWTVINGRKLERTTLIIKKNKKNPSNFYHLFFYNGLAGGMNQTQYHFIRYPHLECRSIVKPWRTLQSRNYFQSPAYSTMNKKE